jgi:hypothetical protein
MQIHSRLLEALLYTKHMHTYIHTCIHTYAYIQVRIHSRLLEALLDRKLSYARSDRQARVERHTLVI